jgi:hypothetical protein
MQPTPRTQPSPGVNWSIPGQLIDQFPTAVVVVNGPPFRGPLITCHPHPSYSPPGMQRRRQCPGYHVITGCQGFHRITLPFHIAAKARPLQAVTFLPSHFESHEVAMRPQPPGNL